MSIFCGINSCANIYKCLESMVGGELFVPKIPSMNMMDLAKAIAPECETKVIGVRPGEKLHEVMVPKDDAHRTIEYDDKYIIKADFRFFGRRFKSNDGKQVPEEFEYNSGTNPWKLSIDEMKDIIKNL